MKKVVILSFLAFGCASHKQQEINSILDMYSSYNICELIGREDEIEGKKIVLHYNVNYSGAEYGEKMISSPLCSKFRILERFSNDIVESPYINKFHLKLFPG